MNEPMCIWRILLPRPLWEAYWTSWDRSVQPRLCVYRLSVPALPLLSPKVRLTAWVRHKLAQVALTWHHITGRSIFLRGHERGQADNRKQYRGSLRVRLKVFLVFFDKVNNGGCPGRYSPKNPQRISRVVTDRCLKREILTLIDDFWASWTFLKWIMQTL